MDSKNIQRYKDKVSRALNLNYNWEGGFDTEQVNKILKILKRKPNIKYWIEVGLHAINECTKLADVYGGDFGIEFYEYFIGLYKDILEEVWRKGLNNEYKEQLKVLKEEAFEGYGYRDELQEIYENYF